MNPQDILYPQSRFEVLKVLYLSPSAVSLREISYRSDVVLNNVQRAVEFLLKEKFLLKKKIGQRICYEISDSGVSDFVGSVIELIEPYRISARAEALKERSLELLDTIEERSGLIRHAKRVAKS